MEDLKYLQVTCCHYRGIHSYVYAYYVTRFWKTDQIVTLGLFYYNYFIGPAIIATLIHYPFTVPLPGLADWFAFLD